MSRARFAVAGLVAAALAGGTARARADEPTTCVQDGPVPTPRDYAGWDRSALVAWRSIEQLGGVLPEIEEDRAQAPPAWWRYPSPLRSAALLAAEARAAEGLYTAVGSGGLQQGDILVRIRGAGACGKMAVVGELVGGKWMTIEGDGAPAIRAGNPLFFDASARLHPEVSAYRIRVKKDQTLGHVRELRRDLLHLERTVGERPPLLAPKGRADVDEKVHELVDEAWSLVADTRFDVDRRELAGRALAVGAALDWPGAAEVAAAVLDEVLRRAPLRADAMLARATLLLLAGEAEKAVTLADAAVQAAPSHPRARYVLGRALIAAGRIDPGVAELRRYLELDPLDPRARRLETTRGTQPALTPPPARNPALQFAGGAEQGGLDSAVFGFGVRWPVTWRVVGLSATAETGLLVNLATGRALLDDGGVERAAAVVFAQRPESATERADLVRKGARTLFPAAKLKPLKPLLPQSRREHFREKREGAVYMGEVTTLECGGAVLYLVLNGPERAYGKLKDEYAALVKSVTFAPK